MEDDFGTLGYILAYAVIVEENHIPSLWNKTDITDKICSFGIPPQLLSSFSKITHTDFIAFAAMVHKTSSSTDLLSIVNKFPLIWELINSFKISEACTAVLASEVKRPTNA